MKSFSYVIKDEIGIHARPAGLLVKEAKNFESTITLECKGKKAAAGRLMAIMGMGVKTGDEVTVSAEGADEDAAIAAFQKFFEENL
ncbi:MAG: HPr family phosphocarrier protein [Lachnospiraceae bacterium]|nr:HPr family phosphocarrier protein [Lachnospiraceae bacterium]